MPTKTDPGMCAGHYVLGEEIASGGFGTVYRAQDQTTGQRVAVKVLHAELVSKAHIVARFQREVRSVRRLSHPNIIKIFDVGELDSGQPYFAMELLEGVSLRERVRADGRLSPDVTLAIIRALGEALAVAHAQGIVHRDVKASNVFITDDDRIVLLDFGVAKLLDDTAECLTSSRHIIGSPTCMAPEQINSGQVDERADIYAVGVLVYELLTGALPFRHRDLAALCDMHLSAPPPLPSRRAPVGAAFDELIACAMAKRATDRYDSVAHLVTALEHAAAQPTTDDTFSNAGTSSDAADAQCVAVYVTAQVVAQHGAELDEQLLDAVEALLPRVSAACARFGFRVVLESGDALLLVAKLPSEQLIAARDSALEIASNLVCEVETPPISDASRVAVFVHVGPWSELVRPNLWVPAESLKGVFVTHAGMTEADHATDAGPDGFRRLCQLTVDLEVTRPTR